MRKVFMALVFAATQLIPLFTALPAGAQQRSLHGYGGFVFDDVVYAFHDPVNGTTARIRNGMHLGAGLEWRRSKDLGLEALYLFQQTRAMNWSYQEAGNPVNTSLRLSMNYLMGSALGYFSDRPGFRPFAGVMAGTALIHARNPVNGLQRTVGRFAWGFRGGFGFREGERIGFRAYGHMLWAMKGIGGDFSRPASGTAVTAPRYATSIQTQIGLSAYYRLRSTPKAVKAPPPPPAAAPAERKPLPTGGRRKQLVSEILLTGDTLELNLFDNGVIDQDTISVFQNDRRISSGLSLESRPFVMRLPVSDMADTTEFVMVAENLGTIPPNTAMMMARDGGKTYEMGLQSTDSTSAMIRFIRPARPLTATAAPIAGPIAATGKPAGTSGSTEAPQNAGTAAARPASGADAAASPTASAASAARTTTEDRLVRQARDIGAGLPEATISRTGEMLRLTFSSGLMFEINSSRINERYKSGLGKLVEVLSDYPGYLLRISGHTDDTGDDDLNLKLSLRRALAVREFLMQCGVGARQMEVSGLGETKPLFPNDGEENRRRNRRVEIEVIQR